MRRRRKIGSLSEVTAETLVPWIAIGIGGYYVITKVLPNILPSLGLGADPASAKVIAAEKALAPASNPFNPNFQPWQQFYNNNAPVYTSGTGGFLGFGQNTSVIGQPVTMADFFNNLTQYG